MQVYKVDEQDVYNQEWELDENYGSIMSSLLGAVLDFTGSEITRLDYSSCSGGGLYTFGRLDQLQSKSALKTIGLDLEGTEPEYQQVFQHISTYPNLNDFYLYSSARASTPLEFRVPVGGLVSKMEVVQIRFHDRSNSRLVMNDEFAKWLSFNKTLAMVIISQPFGDGASSFNDLGSFHSILLNCSQSLTNLTLKGLSLPSGTTAGQVRFHRLRDLELSGNSELINVVMAADFPSLEHSELLIEGRESRFVDHSRILKALESCNSTVKSFQIRLQDTSVAAEANLFKTVDASLSLPELVFMGLYLDDETISRFYLPSLRHVKPETITLPEFSKLSGCFEAEKRPS